MGVSNWNNIKFNQFANLGSEKKLFKMKELSEIKLKLHFQESL